MTPTDPQPPSPPLVWPHAQTRRRPISLVRRITLAGGIAVAAAAVLVAALFGVWVLPHAVDRAVGLTGDGPTADEVWSYNGVVALWDDLQKDDAWWCADPVENRVVTCHLYVAGATPQRADLRIDLDDQSGVTRLVLRAAEAPDVVGPTARTVGDVLLGGDGAVLAKALAARQVATRDDLLVPVRFSPTDDGFVIESTHDVPPPAATPEPPSLRALTPVLKEQHFVCAPIRGDRSSCVKDDGVLRYRLVGTGTGDARMWRMDVRILDSPYKPRPRDAQGALARMLTALGMTDEYGQGLVEYAGDRQVADFGGVRLTVQLPADDAPWAAATVTRVE